MGVSSTLGCLSRMVPVPSLLLPGVSLSPFAPVAVTACGSAELFTGRAILALSD